MMKRTQTIFHHPCKDPHTGHWICNTAVPTRFDHHKYERTFYRLSGLAESVERTDNKIESFRAMPNTLTGFMELAQKEKLSRSEKMELRQLIKGPVIKARLEAERQANAERAAKAKATREANKQKQREKDAAQILSTPERLRSGGHVAGGVPPPDSPRTPRQPSPFGGIPAGTGPGSAPGVLGGAGFRGVISPAPSRFTPQ